MAVETVPDDTTRNRYAPAERKIRVAKPEEGDASGDVFHLIRAMFLIVAVVALIGWAVT